MARSPFWYCVACGAQNHELDGECQYCECEGADCKRDNCSDPAHPGLGADYITHEGADEPDFSRADLPTEPHGPSMAAVQGSFRETVRRTDD